MSSNNRTPQTVLDAPSRTATVISEQHALSRDERRHGVRWPARMKAPEKDAALRDAAKATNVPHVRTEPRRGRKVRRGGVR